MVVNHYCARPDTGLLWGLHEGRLQRVQSPFLGLHERERIHGCYKDWLVIVYTPFVSVTKGKSVMYTPSLHLLNAISNERIPLPGFVGTIHNVALSTDPRSSDCILALCACIGDTSRKSFAWCRPSDSKWTLFDRDDIRMGYDSGGGAMMFNKGKLYLFITKEEFHVFAFDPQPKMIHSGSFNLFKSGSWIQRQMVQSGEELWLVSWRPSVKRDGYVFDVFKQAEEPDKWVRVESLGDQVLLLGDNILGTLQCFSTQHLMGSGFEANCIYSSGLTGDELVKFSVEDGSRQRIRFPRAKKKAFLGTVEWIVPQAWNSTLTSVSLADSSFPHRSFWMPPPVDSVKANFDAKIVKDSATYGIVVRNHLGHVVVCKFGRCSTADALCAESWALLFGLELAGLLNFSRVMFECDNEQLITLLKYEEALPPKNTRGIIKSCKELAAKFEKCSFDYIRREGNEAARGLAILAQSDQCPYANTDVTCLLAPDVISGVICAELSHTMTSTAPRYRDSRVMMFVDGSIRSKKKSN